MVWGQKTFLKKFKKCKKYQKIQNYAPTLTGHLFGGVEAKKFLKNEKYKNPKKYKTKPPP